MPTQNPTGFCPNCNQNVLLIREGIDVCLAIVLAIFTAGIGLLIYLIIYYSRPENRCIHCSTIVQPTGFQGRPSEPPQQITYQPQDYQSPYRAQPQPQPQPVHEYKPVQEIMQGESKTPRFCALCGARLSGASSQKFCPHCGSEL